MANEIRVGWPSGDTLTFVVRDPDNPTKVWYPGGAAWETFGTGSRVNADYDVAIDDKSGDWYVGHFPTGIAAGYYDIILLINGVINTVWGIDWNGTARIESAAEHAAVIKTAIEAAGSHLALIKAITDWQRSASGTVVVNNPGTDTIFDLTAVVGTLSTDDDSCNNMEITIFDNSGSVYETRKVNDLDGTNGRVTLDAALTFPVQDGVDTFILWNRYSPTAAAGSGATVDQFMEDDLKSRTTPNTPGDKLRQQREHF